MTILATNMRNLAEAQPIQMIGVEHGDKGIAAFRLISEALKNIYQYFPPDVCRVPFIVFMTLDNGDKPLQVSGARLMQGPRSLSQDTQGASAITVQILNDGKMMLWKMSPVDIGMDVNTLSQRAVVYRYLNGFEEFFANAKSRAMPKLTTTHVSCYAAPTFNDLREALERYRTDIARCSSCLILNQAWYDEKRIFFKNKPESILRDSLCQFLSHHLRGDVEVRPEQIVDDSHPVDIKVSWMFVSRALIEIKWLGKSKREEDGKITQDFPESRALEGAQQLAAYLDGNKQQAPVHTTMGYLVVFDARRYRVNKDAVTIEHRKGLKFQDSDICYDPKHHEKRLDFEAPIRMFLEPVCSS